VTRSRFAWVLGWAIPPEWFRPMARAAFPAADHVLIEPSASTWDELQAAGPFDWVIGYSLGSLILLQDQQRASALGRRVALLAPIWAFPAEADAGGRIPRANLRALTRAYRNSPAAALDSFYTTAGLRRWSATSGRAEQTPGQVRSQTRSDPARPEVALHLRRPEPQELWTEPEVALHPKPETLEAFRYSIPQGKGAAAHLWGLEQLDRISLLPILPPNWHAWTGENDALLDAARQQTLVSALTIVLGATHHPAELITAFAAASI